MNLETNKEKGRAGLSLAISYFGLHGYTVSIPLNDTQWYDLIIEKDNVFQTVQCKFTASKDNSISMRSTGGTNGKEYDNIRNHQHLDLLFCADKDLNLFLIPFADLYEAGNKSSFRLQLEPSTQGFNSAKYRIQLSD
jgi:hypothetical protein